MSVLTTLKPVLRGAEHVTIDDEAVRRFSRSFDTSKIQHWLEVSPFDISHLGEHERLAFLFVLNSISFSYWGEPKWTIEYKGEQHDGAQAMLACLGRAVENGSMFHPHYLTHIQRQDLEEILHGTTEIPLFDERLRILKEISIVTKQKFRGDFRYLLDAAKGDALELVDLLVKTYPSFGDIAVYNGNLIQFNKRAQLLAADIHTVYAPLINVDKLTACADYKLPQVLRRHGIFIYDDVLQAKIMRREELPKGSAMEVEIRAHTIHAVELIKKQLGNTVTSSVINDYLWIEGQTKLAIDEPYHRTRTIAY